MTCDTAAAGLLLQSSLSLASSPTLKNDRGHELPSTASGLEGTSQEGEIQQDGETHTSLISGPSCRIGDRAVQVASLHFLSMVLGLKSFDQHQCPEDPYSKRDKDRLPHYYFCSIFHSNLQTSKSAPSYSNHFSSLNFWFQCIKQAGLELAATSWFLE